MYYLTLKGFARATLFFIFIVIKFWIKTMKIFIIILLISIFVFSPKIINMYHNFESTVTNEMHNIDLDTNVNESCDQTSIEYKIEYIDGNYFNNKIDNLKVVEKKGKRKNPVE